MELLRLLDDDKQEDHSQKHLEQLQEAAIASSGISSLPEYSLHTAALLGHLESIKQLLEFNSELSKSVDSNGSSALHLASAKGHVGMVNELVSLNSSMCYVSDGFGWSPLHLAAIKGRTAVLEEMLRAAAEAAAVLTGRGESCLHLCVKCNRLEVMKVILQHLERDDRLVDWKDKEGNTVLHLAVAKKQIEIVKYLLSNTGIEPHSRNTNGLTPLDLLSQSPGDYHSTAPPPPLLSSKLSNPKTNPFTLLNLSLTLQNSQSSHRDTHL